MKTKLIISLFLLILLTPIVIGCKGNNAPDEYKPDKIHVNKTSLIMKIGDREQLTASLIPAVAHTPAFLWTSSDNNIVTVSNGAVEAIASGEAVVTVSYQSAKVTISIKVETPVPIAPGVLYDKKLSNSGATPELELNGMGQYSAEGLSVTNKGNEVKLNKFYALAERVVKYHVKLSSDTKAFFKSSQGDFNAYIDVPNKRISIATTPNTEKTVSFLQGDREYIIEIYHIYQQAKVRIIDTKTNEEAEVSATHDGQGGCGAGALQAGFNVGMQWDHYCFGLMQGGPMLVKQITVRALKSKVRLLLYGDSISQPEGYFPSADFSQSWTQQIINRLGGNAVSSGRGGGTIITVLEYIKNELPYIDAEYVMVTVGTNGGNTEENLSELIRYIKSQGAIPILNNMPCNESNTQIDNNVLIAKVRRTFGINGCKFDLATSPKGDGKEVDKSQMYWEDYTGSYGWQIYHHPNEKGGKTMFERTLIDLPEIYQ